MIARGSIRNPFIYLESYIEKYPELSDIQFSGSDYAEIINRLSFYTQENFSHERTRLVQMRKFVAWFAAGFPGAAKFRSQVFQSQEYVDLIKTSEDYFTALSSRASKQIPDEQFMNSGHG